MLVENHRIRLRESFEMITWSVDHGATEHQRTIEFHISAASVDLLNLYLHQARLTDSSSDVNHRRMGSEQMLQGVLPFDFPHKDRLIALLCAIEDARNRLCYGRPQTDEVVAAALAAFNDLRDVFRELGAA